MNKNEILRMAQTILDDVKTAVLATTDKDGTARMRWMTPVFLKDYPYTLFAVTSPAFAKVIHIQNQPVAEWMIQTVSLDKIINLRGTLSVIDNPALKNEVMESVAKRLHTFWKINPDTDFIIIETVIREATLFLPVKPHKETVRFE
ncbi:MAG: pyridoxamine 5'-phosphate oxidase family protein [Candidatus Auribacterota bacterium]|nr:pyridoxamine 5'-phosphate oxidase family protein [Candidatus Auribacterota bacterium]